LPFGLSTRGGERTKPATTQGQCVGTATPHGPSRSGGEPFRREGLVTAFGVMRYRTLGKAGRLRADRWSDDEEPGFRSAATPRDSTRRVADDRMHSARILFVRDPSRGPNARKLAATGRRAMAQRSSPGRIGRCDRGCSSAVNAAHATRRLVGAFRAVNQCSFRYERSGAARARLGPAFPDGMTSAA